MERAQKKHVLGNACWSEVGVLGHCGEGGGGRHLSPPNEDIGVGVGI